MPSTFGRSVGRSLDERRAPVCLYRMLVAALAYANRTGFLWSGEIPA